MKQHVSFLLPLLLLALAAQPVRGQVFTYPAPEGVAQSDLFSVSVAQDGREAASPVFPCRVVNPNFFPRHVEVAAFTQFSFGGDEINGNEDSNGVEVRVRWLGDEPIDSVRVRPLSLGIRAEVEGRDIRFRLSRPQNVSVEVNGDIYHNLMVFACPAEQLTGAVKKLAASQRKKAAAGKGAKTATRIERKGLIYFGPGLHWLEGDTLRVPSGTTVYVACGAVLKGRLLVDHAEDVRIGGRGWIDSGGQAGISVSRSRRVAVDGLVMTQLPIGNSDSVRVSNVKVISSYSWGDGLNVFASSHVSYDRCFARTSDDCTTVYATRNGYSGSSRHIEMERCVLWADIAHPIFIGLHGNVERPDTIEHLRYHDIDILGQHEQQTDYQGCMAIGAGDLNLVRHVEFSDIRVEDIVEGQLVNLRTTWNEKYCRAPGRAIEDVTFRNISYEGRRPNLSILFGYSPDHPVRGVRFENLRLNGRHVFDTMPGKPKWYKTSDLANMYVGENVSGVTFE